MAYNAQDPMQAGNSTSATAAHHLQQDPQPVRMGVQPSYAITFSLDTIEHGFYGNMMNALGSCCGFFGSIPCCFCCPNPYKRVPQGYVGLVSRFGKFYKCVDPGLIKINPFTEEVRPVDVKIQLAEIPSQLIMTKDNVNLTIDSVLYWHIVDPYQAVFGVSDVVKALIERTQTTLRHILGARVVQDCIENREEISFEIQEIIDPVAKLWGVKIESILIKDIQFSKELQESLSSAAQAKRVGESKVIAARAEVDSAQLMSEAAKILNTPAAMQIRYLETMASMARSQGSKVIFMPMPHGGGEFGETTAAGSSASTGAGLSPQQASVLELMSK